MKDFPQTRVALALVVAVSLGGLTGLCWGAVDAAAAEALIKQNNCFKCHGLDKKKDGPSLKEVAAKYRPKSDAEARVAEHLTSGEKAKFPDGHEEDHKIIKAKDPADIKNLVAWILSLQ